jgi:hypothetical protein
VRADDPENSDRRDIDDTIIRLVEPSHATAERPVSVAVDEVLRSLPGVRAVRHAADDDDDGDDASAALAVVSAEWLLAVRGTTVVVPLDRPVIVGRAPGGTRLPSGEDLRRLVVPSDRLGISSTHARIEQLGHTLVVTDLGSTNGLHVHWASGPARRLRPGESCAVLPDAAVDLGDGIVLEFHPNPSAREESS